MNSLRYYNNNSNSNNKKDSNNSRLNLIVLDYYPSLIFNNNITKDKVIKRFIK